MDPPQQVRQPFDRQQLPLGDPVGLRRRAHPLLPFRDVVHHAGLRCQRDAVADAQVSRNAGLAGHGDVGADLRAARDAHLGDDDRVFADGDVVGDLHEIIDLRALADDRGPKRRPVDRGVGTDLDVILDQDLSHLRHLAVLASIKHVSESVRPDHRAGMDPHAFPEMRTLVERHVREQARLLTHRAVVPHVDLRDQHRTRPDLDPLTHHAMRPNVRCWINLRRRCHHRRRMDAGRESRFREEQRQHLREGHPGVRHADQGLGIRRKIFGHQDGRGRALLRPGEVGFVLGKGQVSGLGRIRRGKSCERQVRIPDDGGPDSFGDLAGGVRRHGRRRVGWGQMPRSLTMTLAGPSTTTRGCQPVACAESTSVKDMMVMRSPGLPRCATAPLSSIAPDPRGPRIT